MKSCPIFTFLKQKTAVCFLSLLVAVSVIGLISCKGSDGPTGPAGSSGNPEIRIYNYGSRTTDAFGFINYVIDTLSEGYMDSCLILAYFKPQSIDTSFWYQCPGLGMDGAYTTRYFISNNNFSIGAYGMGVRLLTPDGSAFYTVPTTFSQFRIILAPASYVVQKRISVGDLSHYAYAKAALHLPD